MTTFDLTVPQPPAGTELNLNVSTGEIVFVLGANGTGKSSLMQRYYTAHRGNARRISAHRQTWFSSDALSLSPQQKRQTEPNMSRMDIQPQARWMDDYSAPRAAIAIYDLIDAENIRARKWASTAGKAKPLRESSAIRQRVLELAEEVRRGEVEPKIANAIAVLSNVAISTLRLDTKIRELEDLEARIRQLETAVESDR